MKPSRILVTCLCAFVLLLFTLLVAFNHTKPRLLVINSYPEDDAWVQAFDRGVQQELANNRQPISVRQHYMSFEKTDIMNDGDWAAASVRARAEIDSWKPDVVLLVGQEAQQWVGNRYVTNDPEGQRLVYVSGEHAEHLGYFGAVNIVGVREMLPLAQVQELLKELDIRHPRIQALGFDDPTGQADLEQVQAFDWQPATLLPVVLAKNYDVWQRTVQEASEQADVLLVLSYVGLPRSEKNHNVVDWREITQWTEENAKPLPIGIRIRYTQGGGSVAIAPSATALGEQALHLALLAMPGNPMPTPQKNEDFIVGLNPQRLQTRGYHLPGIYTQAARVAGQLVRRPTHP